MEQSAAGFSFVEMQSAIKATRPAFGRRRDILEIHFRCRAQHVAGAYVPLRYRQTAAELGYCYEPDKLIGYCVSIYFAKLLVWDKVLGLGSTDPLAGFAAITANLVVSFYFAKRGFENVARIIKR